MRTGCGRPRGDVDLEREPVCSALVEELVHHPDELPLGPPGERLLDKPLVRAVGDRRGPANRIELLRLLDRPQRLHQPPPRHELDAAVAEKLVVRVRERVGLERHPRWNQLREVREEVAPGFLDLHPFDLPRPLRVTEVGEEPYALGFDQHGCIRALEPGQVPDVDRRRDEERLLEQLAEAIYPRARNSSASL
jgi:hypothetical protein